MKNRAIRRQQRKRFLKRMLRIAKGIYRPAMVTLEEHAENADKWARKNYKHRKSCSCQMCRNPRHSDYNKPKNKETIQERKEDLREKSFRDTEGDPFDESFVY